MAEARLGVHPMPGLQRAGFEVDTNVKVCQAYVGKPGLVVYIPHPRYWWRGVRRWVWRGLNKTRVAFYPLPVWIGALVTTAITGIAIKSPGTSWLRSGALADILWRLDSKNPIAHRLPVPFRVGYLAAGTSACAMLGFAATQRFVLRRLLSYHGWLDRANHKSLKTKVWGLLMKKLYLNRIAHQLNAYQWCLPKLPMPTPRETCKKYLETVRPLMSPEDLAEHQQAMEKFLQEEAPALQWRLRLKWLFSRNYISDWWLDFVYLRSRDPLPINSNWYGLTFADYLPTHSQAARAAAATFTLVRLRYQIDTETMEPQILAGVAPMCMAQYPNAFSLTRVPNQEQDVLEKYDSHESRHVAVLSRGRIFKLPVYSPNTMQQLSPLQLFKAYEGILDSPDQASEAEALLPALTAQNRSTWAQIREEYFEGDRHNAARLEAIESAIFVVCLDDEEPETWTEEGKNIMCGNGHNRWCDKSFNLVVTKNGKAGVHAEHSWGDAPALAHLFEMMMISERKREFYNPDGTIKVLPQDELKMKANKFITYPAMRIDFRVPPSLLAELRKAQDDFQQRIDDFDLYVSAFTKHGKKLIAKSAKTSPDAYIQMALQLAYYRDQGHFDLTYESSTTRLFRDGRTETIRSLSTEATAFVLAFVEAEKEGGVIAKKEKLRKLLRAACEQHQRYTMDTMRGHGVDRHLFAMYVMSHYLKKPSDFLKKALGRAWTLSTSQVPPRQCPDSMYGGVNIKCPNGGFGPVSDTGYGVCYNVYDDCLHFNVSTKKAAPNTDAERFNKRICKTLEDMAAMFE